MDVSTVKKMFKESLKKSSPVSHVILQLLAYCGLRLTILSRLLRSDIVRTELIKNGSTEFKYSVKAKGAKGGKNRTIGVKDSVGKSLWGYAQSCKTEHLFCGKNGGHLSSGAVANRIKILAKKSENQKYPSLVSTLFCHSQFACRCQSRRCIKSARP
jgi:integrase